jgi:hypothetical protein
MKNNLEGKKNSNHGEEYEIENPTNREERN